MTDAPPPPPFGWAPPPLQGPQPGSSPSPSDHDGIAHLLGSFDQQPAGIAASAPSSPLASGSIHGSTHGSAESLPSRRDIHRPPPRTALGVIALVVGLVAFAVSLYQPFAIFAIVPGIVAIVLGIVAVARRGARKALATVGLVIAALAVPIAAFSYSAGLQSGSGSDPDALVVAQNSSEPSDSPSASPSASASASAAAEVTPPPVVVAPPATPVRDARLGGTAKDSRGVAFTLEAVTCGLSEGGGATPQAGQEFCAVQVTAVNRGGASVTLTSADVSLIRADSAFWATVADFGGSSSATLAPGNSTHGTFWVEVTPGVRLEAAYLGSGANFIL